MMHPNVKHLLNLFKFAHLPPKLQAISARFAALATTIAAGPQNPETSMALRKLLEAKDCAVRAVVIEDSPDEPEHSNGITDHAYTSNGASRDPSCAICGKESYDHKET